MIAAALLLTLLGGEPAGFQAPQAETIAEVRVHGNATLSDESVLKLAGVAVGSPLDAGGTEAIAKRLKESGRFDEVRVNKRYRTLAMDEIALVLVVHEHPGVSPTTGEPPSMLRRIRNRLMFFPILKYDDGYGWTYGGQTAVVDALGKGTRLSFPLSWGGTKRAAVEADHTFKTGPLTRLTGTFGITERENPHYEIDDQRTQVNARAERRLFNVLTLGGDLGRTQMDYFPLHESFWADGADVTVDTRRDPMYPSDAVLATVSWSRLNPIGVTSFGGDPVDRYRVDARGFKRLIGQSVLAVRAGYDTASAPLPQYEQWLLGGSSLRGIDSGTYAGDKRFLWSAEVRVPFSSPLSMGRVGFNVFMDGGTTALFGERIKDQPLHKSAGAGLFLTAAIIQLNFDVSRSIDGKSTRFHFGTGFTF
jgi:outer membrane protein assembly factor BamA